MTASNMWALIVGGLAAGGALTGAIVWQQRHPDMSPAKVIAKLTEAPSLNPPNARPAPERPASSAGAAPSSKTDGGALVKGPPPKPEPASGHGEPPHFDVVRVEPNGEAVLAGKGDPNAKVALLAEGKVVAETKADANGQFVLMPPALQPGDHDLSLRSSSDGKPASESKQNVAVSVPAKPNGEVVVALAEPGKPTKVLSGPPEQKNTAKPAPGVANAPPMPKAPAADAVPPRAPQVALAKPETAVAPPAPLKPAGPDLAIRSVELENGNGFYASGAAAAGTRIQLYLNGAHLAEVVAGRDNRWSLTVKKGLRAGHYTVRADASGEGRKVTARVEVPFDVPVAMAAAAQIPHEAPPAAVVAQKPADAVEAPAIVPSDLGNPSESTKPLATRTPQEASQPKIARGEVPAIGVTPTTPPQPQSPAPTPRPAIAAAAKAKSAAAPSAAPPVMAVAKPTPPEKRPVPSPADAAVSPPRPANAPPTIAAAAPTVAPPQAAEMAKSAPVASSPEPARESDPANAVIEQVETATVVRGDNLWNISRDRLGEGYRYTRIYAANTNQIRDPKLIYPGQVFVMPSKNAER